MNKRNWEVFGPSKKTRYMVISIVVIIVLVIAAWMFMNGETPTAAVISQPSNQLTGASIDQEQQNKNQQELEQQQEEQTPSEEEIRKYNTYSGQCAFDMKQREDDITDATNNRDTYQKELTTLSEEYEAKKKELDEQYSASIERLKTKTS